MFAPARLAPISLAWDKSHLLRFACISVAPVRLAPLRLLSRHDLTGVADAPGCRVLNQRGAAIKSYWGTMSTPLSVAPRKSAPSRIVPTIVEWLRLTVAK